MPDIQLTLDLIDGAIEDYLSPDAMRWTPDEDQRAEVRPDAARGQSLNRMWIDDVEVTDFVRSVDLNPTITLDNSEGQFAPETPLRRLSFGPVRGPLSDRVDWRGYWPREAETASERIDGLVSDWMAAHMPEMPPLTDFQGHLLDGIEVAVSNLVPDGQVYVINRRALAEAQRDALSNISFVYDTTPMRFNNDLYRFRATAWMPPLLPFQRHMLDLLLHGNAHLPLARHRRNSTYRRSHRAGYTPPRDNPRMRALNLDRRHRQLARRRRNR